MLFLVHTDAPTLTSKHPQCWQPGNTLHDFWRASQAGSKNYASSSCLWSSPHRASLKSSFSTLSMPQSCQRKETVMQAWSLGATPTNSKPLEISGYVAKVWEMFGSTWLWENTFFFKNLLQSKLTAATGDASSKSEIQHCPDWATILWGPNTQEALLNE